MRELKAAGHDIVDMTIGEPDFDTPDHVKAAAHAAIDRGETKYTAVNGTPALRAAIISDYKRRLGLDYAESEICVGGGAKQILFLALMASVEEGAEVIIPAPYWVSYPDMVIANDGKPVIVACSENVGFKLTPAALEAAITPRTRWLILNTPSNPTGAAYDRAELEALGEVLLRHPHVMVLSDDIYDQIWFRDEPMTTLAAAVPALKDRILLTNGVSKSYAMTGWRIGYAAGPAGADRGHQQAAVADVVLSVVDQPGRCSPRACQRAELRRRKRQALPGAPRLCLRSAQRRAPSALPGAGRCVLSLSELRGCDRQGHAGRQDDRAAISTSSSISSTRVGSPRSMARPMGFRPISGFRPRRRWR